MFIPFIIESFPHLRLKNDVSILWIFNHSSLSTILDMPKMLSPFIIKNKELTISLNSKVYDWVYENRYYNNTTKDDIIKAYKLFIKKYK